MSRKKFDEKYLIEQSSDEIVREKKDGCINCLNICLSVKIVDNRIVRRDFCRVHGIDVQPMHYCSNYLSMRRWPP